ncbi:MAG: hypothetical protein KDC13_08810 [Bacteroidetes bacterium]|nr:hypothetical protein [Bacteroidota bacterium]
MRILNFVVVILLSFGYANAQTESSTGFVGKETDAKQKVLEKGKNYDVNFDISNHEAFFLEGEDSLFAMIYRRLDIPKEAADINLVANAIIGFQVNFNGQVQEAYSISKVGYGIDEQLIKILNSLEFVPATQGDIPYRSEVVFEIPIKAPYLYNIQHKVGME